MENLGVRQRNAEGSKNKKQKVEVLASMPSYKMLLDHPGDED